MRRLVALPFALIACSSSASESLDTTEDALGVDSGTGDAVSDDTLADGNGEDGEDAPNDHADTAQDAESDGAWCHDGECGPVPVLFIPQLGLIDHVFSHDLGEDPLGMGSGAGFIDFDHDGDVDVFLGASAGGSSACLYRNDSTIGALEFAAVEAVCGREFSRPIHFARGVDDRDGHTLLLIAGSRFLEFFELENNSVIDLFATLPVDDDRRRCDVNAVRSVDLNGDGREELYVGCGHVARDTDSRTNIVFEHDGAEWAAWSTDEAGLLANRGATLAVAVTDLGNDGLVDLFLANDTFSGPDQRNTSEVPGVWLHQTSSGDWESAPISEDETAFGSFMGTAFLRVADSEIMVVTDWGPMRQVDTTTLTASEFEPELGWLGARALFSWSAIPFDFDGNGLIDVFVTLGDVHAPGSPSDPAHEDHLLLQFEDGFAALPRSVAAPDDENPYSSSRAASLVDLDGDGIPELVTVPLVGPVRIDQIQLGGELPVCVATAESGAIPRARVGDAEWTLDNAAHLRLGAPDAHFIRGTPELIGAECVAIAQP